jgi:hypothetical protein
MASASLFGALRILIYAGDQLQQLMPNLFGASLSVLNAADTAAENVGL